MLRCPGQDGRNFRPGDVFEVKCRCGAAVEFWRDDARRRCRSCGATLENPRLDLGCAAWCRHGRECLEAARPRREGERDATAPPTQVPAK